MKLSTRLTLLLVFLFAAVRVATAGVPEAARNVIARAIPGEVAHLVLEGLPAKGECDLYEYAAKDGVLTVRGSTAVAICRGFYDYLRANDLGMVGWAGTRVKLPNRWPDAPLTSVVTPYSHRFYLNVVTYGYTMPYWDWPRWERELDWMAMHGINMPLALVGTEAIGTRVWKRMGLTQEQINPFYTGPAHLPWQRMGNLAGLDGPLPKSWDDDQVALQHKILKRMRELGIEPIAPAFAGFVPPAFQSKYPDADLHELGWAGFPPTKFLAPTDPLFQKLGAMYIQEWEHEFGKARYFLSDSFNEMQLPKTGKPVVDLLADYGDCIYKSLKSGDPNAVWVLQGWMFGYQRDIWNPQTVKALLSKVPDDRMLILDEACDYNGEYWHNGMNWQLFDGFDNKPWVYGVIPNMGGKTGWTGVLDFYATDSALTVNSPNKGRLAGMGFAPEGIENNETIYELMSDMAWRTSPLKVDDWIRSYCRNRYGACPETMINAWKQFQATAYGTFTDHPRFGWQTARFGPGSVNHDPRFLSGVQDFLAAASELSTSPLYRADAIELSATALCLKADSWFGIAREAQDTGGPAKLRDEAFNNGLSLLADADRLLESHPLDRLQRWLDFTDGHGASATERRNYEADARRLITVWGPPENDYSARMWSGLIRDFYAPRMKLIFSALLTGKPFDRKNWEEAWVMGHGVSHIQPFADPLTSAATLVNNAVAEPMPILQQPDSIGSWAPADMSTENKTMEWPITSDQLHRLNGVRFHYVGGAHRLDIQWVAVLADGQEVARDSHLGYAGLPDNANRYTLDIPKNVQGNNGCVIRASVHSTGGTDSRGVVQLLQAAR